MPLQKLTFQPGINKENTDYASEGGWYNCDKIRFRSGSPEKVGGWANYSASYTFFGDVHSLWNWTSYVGENLCAVGTNQKYYVELGGQYHDITPLRTTVTLGANPIATTSGSKLVTITATGHGAAVNTFITISGATAVGGLTINGEYEIVAVPDGNSYQIVSATAAGSTATGGGAAVSVAYQINAGNAVVVTSNGWGSGAWSSGVWGTSAGSTLVTLRLWSQSNYQQDLIFNPATYGLYYWHLDTSSFARAVTLNAYANTQTKSSTTGSSGGIGSTITVLDSTFIDIGAVVTGTNVVAGTTVTNVSGTTITLSTPTTGAASGTYTFSYAGLAVPNQTYYVTASDIQRFTIVLGSNPYDPTNFSSAFDPMIVRWSDQDNPYDWTPTTSNQSGEQRLSNGSYLVTSVNTRQEVLVWSDSALYSMQYIGPPYVWGFNLVGDNISIVSPNAAVTINNVTYWMGQDKFYTYSGRVDTLPCTLKRYVFDNINVNELNQIVCGSNEGFDEIWWFYPSATSMVNDSYVIYNHVDNIWYYGSINRTAWLDSPLRPYPMGVFSLMNSYLNGALGTTDTSVTLLNGTSYPSSGTIKIDSEYITYTGITGNTLTGCVRGASFNGTSSTAASHVAYSTVNFAVPNQLIFHEIGCDDATTTVPTAINAYLESADFDISDGHQMAFVWRMLPDFTFTGSTATNPQITLTLKPRLNLGTNYTSGVDAPTVTRTATIPVEQYTGQVYTRVRGRQLQLRIDSNMLGVQWQSGNNRIDVRPDGRR